MLTSAGIKKAQLAIENAIEEQLETYRDQGMTSEQEFNLLQEIVEGLAGDLGDLEHIMDDSEDEEDEDEEPDHRLGSDA